MTKLVSDSKVTRVSNSVAAGVTTINSSSVLMDGFESVTFTVAFGAIDAGAVTSCKLQSSPDDAAWTDLSGVSHTVADTDDNKLFVLELHKPRHKYVRCVVSRATANSVVDSIVAQQTLPSSKSTTHDSTTVGAYSAWVSP